MIDSHADDVKGDSFFIDGEKASQKIIYGNGVINRAGEVAKECGSNLLLVTDSGLSSAGHPQKLLRILRGVACSFHNNTGTTMRAREHGSARACCGPRNYCSVRCSKTGEHGIVGNCAAHRCMHV